MLLRQQGASGSLGGISGPLSLSLSLRLVCLLPQKPHRQQEHLLVTFKCPEVGIHALYGPTEEAGPPGKGTDTGVTVNSARKPEQSHSTEGTGGRPYLGLGR